ncbi:MAG: outer membrane protein assembly factor BamD [Phycisphaerales bacterium]|nr:outer membrane protein assembly factor BamD [Phycisphaerales bacterium]
MTPPRTGLLFIACWLALSASLSAWGQSESRRLDEGSGWRQEAAAPGNEDDAVMAEARRQIADDRARQALSTLTKWIDSNARTGKPQLAEAHRLRGDALVALGQEYRALYDYEVVALKHAQSDQYPIAIQRELDIGIAYANGKKRKLWGLIRVDDAGEIAQEILVRVQERLPGSVLAEQAAIELADYYFRKREMDLASEAYNLYLINFPAGPNRRHAMERRVYASIAEFNGPNYDGTSLLNAREQTRAFAREYPAEAAEKELDQRLVDRIDEASAAQMLSSAMWYRKVGDEAGERLTLRRLVHKHPRTVAADTALTTLDERGWLRAPEAPPPEATPETTPAPPSEAEAAPAEGSPSADAPAPGEGGGS